MTDDHSPFGALSRLGALLDIVDDQTRTRWPVEVAPSSVDEYEKPVSETDQVNEVEAKPRQPAGRSSEYETAMELSYASSASDGCHLFIPVDEDHCGAVGNSIQDLFGHMITRLDRDLGYLGAQCDVVDYTETSAGSHTPQARPGRLVRISETIPRR